MSVRQIILDTETTGIDPGHGHRVIEIGCIEMIDRRLTNNHFHFYLNPEREIDEGAAKVHGLTVAFLQDKPKFKEIVEQFLAYIQNSELIIHNAPFDVGFLNHELQRVDKNLGKIPHYAKVVDTLTMARQKHPGQKNNLDALCKRYNVSNEHRQLHGALLDAQLLAHVYLAMTRGQMSMLAQDSDHSAERNNTMDDGSMLMGEVGLVGSAASQHANITTSTAQTNVVIYANDVEQTEHEKLLEQLKKKAQICLWEDA